MALSEACCTPAPPACHLNEGVDTQIGGLQAYVNAPEGATAAVIFASDIWGYDPPLSRKLADKLAAAGYLTVIPDFFKGNPYKATDPENLYAGIGEWISSHTPELSVEDAKIVIQELKTTKGITSIGISGFCWGAKLAFLVSDDVQAIVACHPSLVTDDDIKAVKVPVAILGSEIDQQTPPEKVKQFQDILNSKPEVPSFVKVYPGTFHGWTIRYDINDLGMVKRAEESHEDMISWFNKHLH